MNRAVTATALAAFLAVTALPASAQQRFEVQLRGQEVALADQPVAAGAFILVPMRESLAAIGAQNIRFDAATQRVTFTYNGRPGVVNLRTQQAMVNGSLMALAAPAQIINGRAYIGSEFIATLEPEFQTVRVAVAGFRGAPGLPEALPFQTFTIGGQQFTYQARTWEQGGVLMVPLNETLAALGLPATDWQSGDLQATFTYEGQPVLLNLRSGYAYVGAQAFVLDRPVQERAGILYVPATFIRQLVPTYSIVGVAGLRVTPTGAAAPVVDMDAGK